MQFKEGVKLLGLHNELVVAFPIIDRVYREVAGVEAVCTSARDSKHSRHSHHYKGMAIDLRVRHVKAHLHWKLTEAIQQALSDEYQVIYEHNHIHVEYDPAHLEV